MHETLTSKSTRTRFRGLWRVIGPAGRYFARLREWHRGAAVNVVPGALGRRDAKIDPRVGKNPGSSAPGAILFYRAQPWIGGLDPDEPTPGTVRIQRASALRDRFRLAVRDRSACVALVLLVLAAVLMSPIPRSSASDSPRPHEGLRQHVALPAPDSSRLSVTAWIMREDAVVTVSSEDDDDDDDESCSAARHAYDTYASSLSPARSVPAWSLAMPSRLSTLHRLRC
jgi:hypothetical protein